MPAADGRRGPLKDSLLLWIAVRLYAALLVARPADFRRQYGAEMTALFRARCERARTGRGRRGLAACGVAGCTDLVAGGVADRLLRHHRARSSPRESPAPRGDSMLAQLTMDLRVAARTFRRQPFFTATVVATLAVGIGATTAVFGLVDAAVLRPFDYPESRRLVSLVQQDKRFGTIPFAAPFLPDLRERMRSVDRIAGFSPSWQVVLTGGGDARTVTAGYVSDGALELFGAEPVRGRLFAAAEHASGGPAVALVSESFWRRQFGSDAALDGQIIRLDDQPFAIVGTLPDDVRMPITSSVVNRSPAAAEVWLPFALNPFAALRTIPVMNVVGRLRDGVTPAMAQEEIRAVGQTLARDYQAIGDGGALDVIPLRVLVSRDVRRPLLLLFGARARPGPGSSAPAPSSGWPSRSSPRATSSGCCSA